MTEERWQQNLLEQLERGRLALFIGADLPREITGLPSQAEMAQDLARRRSLDGTLSLAQVAQRLSKAGSRWEFTDIIRNAVDTTHKSPQLFHQRVVELVKNQRIETLVTTAYDDLLEQAFREASVGFNRVVRGSDVSFISPDRPTLVRLYGDAQQPDSLVVTEDDHFGLWRDREKEDLLDEVRAALRKNAVLFLGYDLSDPDFYLLWREVLDRAGRFAMGAYAVWPDIREDERRLWQDRQIRIIEEEPLAFLERLSVAAAALDKRWKDKSEQKGKGETRAPESLYGTGNRWAVLVGVNEYVDGANYGRLQVCVQDVEAIRDRLVAGGFDSDRIRLLTDQTPELPTRANILVALKAVAEATEPDDLMLFYYSGHGDEADGESYLVGRDGRRLVLNDTAVSVSRVKEIIEAASVRAKVIILDACHSGADIGGKGPKPMTAEFIQRVFEQAEGLAILASCKQGQLSYEWRENERSVFTHYLLEAFAGAADRDEKGFVTVQDASRHVTNGVKLWASQRNASQTPTLQYTAAGDIILVAV